MLTLTLVGVGCGESERNTPADPEGQGASAGSSGGADAASGGNAGSAGGGAGKGSGGDGEVTAGFGGAMAGAGGDTPGAGGDAGSAGAETAGSGGSAGGSGLDPVECTEVESEAPIPCELEGCSLELDRSMTCSESADQDLMELVLTEDAAYFYIPIHNDGRLLRMIPEGDVLADSTFPFLAAPLRLAAAHSGELFAHGYSEGAQRLGRGVFEAWETVEGPTFGLQSFLYADASGEPVLFGGTGTYQSTLHGPNGAADASWIGEPRFFVIDGANVPVAVGYEPLYTDDDHVYAASGPEPLSLVEDPLRGEVLPAPLPPREPGESVVPELALVRSADEALRLGWLDGTAYSETSIEDTSVGLVGCSGSTPGYGSCQPDCELTGTSVAHVAATRDRRGNAYVAFVHTTVDRTVSGSYDASISYCNYNTSRDSSTHELRVIRFDNGETTARPVLTLPATQVFSLRMASFGDDFALAMQVPGRFRVVRFSTGG